MVDIFEKNIKFCVEKCALAFLYPRKGLKQAGAELCQAQESLGLLGLD